MSHTAPEGPTPPPGNGSSGPHSDTPLSDDLVSSPSSGSPSVAASSGDRATTEVVRENEIDGSPAGPVSAGLAQRNRINFAALAGQQILLRTGWIFKTESIVMPAVLDSIAGPGWIRGWLPLLNRFGHSFAPLFLARTVKVTRRKKWILVLSTSSMAALFLLLASFFAGSAARSSWMPLIFLCIYAAFFMCNGISQLAFGTLQGKLVGITSRGRLLLVSTTVGSVTAVSLALLLLPEWLQQDAPRFDLLFGFSGAIFALSAVAVVFVAEPADNFHEPVKHLVDDVSKTMRGAWTVWRGDRNFRRLSIVAAMLGASIMLFPHYQNLGLTVLHLELDHLVAWVVIQNIGTGLFSIPAGRIADKHGNRMVLLIATLGLATAPLLAIFLKSQPAWGGNFFPLIFVFVGLTPVLLRTLQNFTLELSSPADHPLYLSTLAVCMAGPVLLSPAVGWLIDVIGFNSVFSSMAAVIVAAWLLTFTLQEPRNHVHMDYLESVE